MSLSRILNDDVPPFRAPGPSKSPPRPLLIASVAVVHDADHPNATSPDDPRDDDDLPGSKKRRRAHDDDIDYKPPGHRRVRLLLLSLPIFLTPSSLPAKSPSAPNHSQSCRSPAILTVLPKARMTPGLYPLTWMTAKTCGQASSATICWRLRSAKSRWKSGLRPAFWYVMDVLFTPFLTSDRIVILPR